MTQREAQFVKLEDGGDMRGVLFGVPMSLFESLGPVGDFHFGEICSGSMHGNHAHLGNSELLLVKWKDRVQIAYDNGADQFPIVVELEGSGAAALLLPPGCAHAIRNTGEAVMEFISMPSAPFDTKDIVRRKVLG